MKNILYVILIILSSTLFELYAQTAEIDSLENLLQNYKGYDTVKINLLNEISKKLFRKNNDKMLQFSQKALKLSEELNFKKGKAKSLYSISEYYLAKVDYVLAIDYIQQALEIFEDIGDKKGISTSFNHFGAIYYYLGNYIEAIECFQKSYRISEEIDNKEIASHCLNNIAIIYSNQGNYHRSLEYNQKALKIRELLGNKISISHSLNNIGILYFMQGNSEDAMDCYEKSLRIKEEFGDKLGVSNTMSNIISIYIDLANYTKALEYNIKILKVKEEIGDKKGIAVSLLNFGIIYGLQANYKQALKYHYSALNIRKEIGDKSGICESKYNIGDIYYKLNNNTKALDYAKQSLEIASQLNLLNNQKDIYELLSAIYAAKNNYRKAFENYKLYKELNDSIFNEENIKKITGLKFQYEFDKEKKVIELEQQKKDVVYNNETKRQKIIRNSLIGGFMLMLLLVAVILRSFIQKRKANNNLRLQKKKIEEKNYELLQKNKEIRNQSEQLEVTNIELAKLSVVASETKNCIMIMNADGDFQWFNKAFFTLFGYNESEYKNKYGTNILDISNNEKINEEFDRCIKNKEAIDYISKKYTKLGKELWLHTTLSPVIDDKGAVTNVIAVDSDITLIKQAEVKIKKQNDKISSFVIELENLNRTKDKFFSIVAHDLKGPFTAMLGFSKMLIKNFDNFNEAKKKEFIKFINKGLQNTYKLLEDLLLWSRAQRDVIDFNPSNEKLHLFANAIILVLSTIAQKKSINIKNEIPKDIVVWADKLMLSTILRNLISNSIKFTPNAGNIIIKAHKITDKNNLNYIEICIQDDGVGISPARLQRLFKIEENISTLGTESEEGSGFGLVLCKEFVEQHKGKIWVESELEKGSVFKFILPC